MRKSSIGTYKTIIKIYHNYHETLVKFINFNFRAITNWCFIGKVDPAIFDNHKYAESSKVFKFITDFDDDLDDFFDDSVSQRACA